MSPRVAIIGAGPAGTTLALSLVKLGVEPRDLVVFDKARFPRPKLCGGGITFRGTQLFETLLGAPPVGGLTTRSLEFACAGVGSYTVREPGPQWVHDRAALDHQLVLACRARGITLREEADVTDLEPVAGGGWRVRTGSAGQRVTETFPWVAACDGATSLARRRTGLFEGTVGRLVEAVFERDGSELRDDVLYFDFDPILEGIPGYAWVFPYQAEPGGAVRYKLGVMDGRGRVPGAELRRSTLAYARRKGFRLLDPKVAGWPERYFHPDTAGHVPGLLLVGEAYGIDPLLGEGIAPAMFHAAYAAERLRAALDAGTSRIRGFERGFRGTPEGRNLWLQWHLAERLYGKSAFRWLRVLFGMPHLRALAGSGEEAYGRLARCVPGLAWRFALTFASGGLPTSDPIQAPWARS